MMVMDFGTLVKRIYAVRLKEAQQECSDPTILSLSAKKLAREWTMDDVSMRAGELIEIWELANNDSN